jgi:hypothetical protein
MSCGIHTINIATNDIIYCRSDSVRECIKADKSRVNPNTGEIIYKAIINPNKLNGYINAYEDLQKVFPVIIQEMGISNYRIARADFAVDSFENNYNELHKINKCICLLLAVAYHIKNRYESTDPLSLEHLTTRVQSEYLECENYNKDIESDHTSPVYNRLEFRSKAILKVKKDIPTLINDWCSRLEYSITCFDKLQGICNDYLIQRWNIENDMQVKSTSEFLRKYQDNIYTSRQIANFYSRLNYDKPESKAKNFKRYNRIEYFSLNDLKSYAAIIKNALWKYVKTNSKSAMTALKS